MSAAARLRVLIADDTPDIRDLLRIALGERYGFDIVGEAADGSEAVSAAHAHRPDVVLLDLSMPRMDGLTAIPEIRRVSPDTKIVVLSGFDATLMAEEALERGADAYFPKGETAGAIAGTLMDVCGRAANGAENPRS